MSYISDNEESKHSERKEEKGNGVVTSSENSWICRRSWAQPRRDSAKREDSSEVYCIEL
jgi:hypothetical protein